MKILVVEDDHATAQALQILFSSYHYAVDIAADGEIGLQMANDFEYDLLLLDVFLPRLDGVGLCQKLRARGFQPPILLLTGQGGGHQKAIALNVGADDYVVKPFDAEELIARVQALLRRGGPKTQPILTWGNLSVDPSSRRVTYGTRLISVTPKEYGILELFLRHSHKVFSARAILDQVWSSVESPGEEAIRVHIKELRKKFKEVGAPKDFIKTVYRTGYRLNPVYADLLASQIDESLTPPQIAELKSVNSELRATVNALQATQAELNQKNQELEGVYVTLEQERRQLQAELVARQQIETCLLESEQRYASLVAAAPVGIFRHDAAGRCMYVNDRFCQISGLSPETALGDGWKTRVHPDDRSRVMVEWEKFVQSGCPGQLEYRFHHPSGLVKWIYMQTVVERDAHGQVIGYVGTIIDISDRKQAEVERTRAEETRKELTILEQVLDNVLAGYWEWDIPNGREYFSRGFKRMFGYEDHELFNTPESWKNLIFPEDLPTVLECFERHVQSRGKIPYYNEVRYRHKNGSTVWVIYSGQVIEWDDADNPLRMVGFHLDISDRKQAEEALRESDARWQFALEGSGDGVWDWNPQTKTAFFSRQWKAMLGYADHEVGNTLDEWDSRIHPDDKSQTHVDLNKHFSGETSSYQNEHRIRCRDGRYKWILGRGKVIEWTPDGRPLRVIGTHTDITDRKLADQKIREQAALLDIASNAIFVRDLDQQILYWNQGAERLYGWQADDAIGQKANELFQNDESQTEAIMKTLLEQGEWRGEIHEVTKAGQEVTVDRRWTLARDDAGQPKFILSVDTDITEKKQLEAQFHRAQRLESLGRLASGIAHDLNNVFTPILTIAQLLRLMQKGLDTPAQEQLKLIEESAKRGANMVKQILTFARGKSGERTPVDLTSLLREVINIVQQSFPKSIEIHQDFPEAENTDPALGAVLADPTHLHQVLMNLCINARDAMPSGGMLTLSAENTFVDENVVQVNLEAQGGNYVVLTIADSGTGIAPEVRDRMFEPFFTTKQRGQGSGLGLSTVLGIVKNYGGFLQVFSELGQGTQVKVYLPAIESTPTERSQSEGPFKGNGERVLIVDDDVVVQQTNQALLECHHYTTLIANDGVEAVSLYAQFQDDIKLVVLDVMMPNMGGIPLILKLRKTNPRVKIIAISGLPTNRGPVLAAGANAFLAKPYPLESLLRTVSDLVNDRQSPKT